VYLVELISEIKDSSISFGLIYFLTYRNSFVFITYIRGIFIKITHQVDSVDLLLYFVIVSKQPHLKGASILLRLLSEQVLKTSEQNNIL